MADVVIIPEIKMVESEGPWPTVVLLLYLVLLKPPILAFVVVDKS